VKQYLFLLLFFLASFAKGFGQQYALIPEPVSLCAVEGCFEINRHTKVFACDPQLKTIADSLSSFPHFKYMDAENIKYRMQGVNNQ